MHEFRITAAGGLAPALVAAFLRNAYPSARISVSTSESRHGVRVDLLGADRWLFVATRGGRDESIAEALSDGASAVVTLDSDPAEFECALQALVGGRQTFVPDGVMRQLAAAALGRKAPDSGLTAREAEVLQLVARGHSNNEIADSLVISPNTVRSHLHALSVKLKASSRTKMLVNARALNIPEAFEEERVADASAASA